MSIAERPAKPTENVPALAGPRLPYHPAIETRFGIDKASWKALVEAIFPGAQSVESVILALSYCRARKLDPFKRVVHIVPIWEKARGCMVDTVWPGIGELRTTAFRTGCYAGRGDTKFGPDITKKLGKTDMVFPEWAQVSVFRIVQGQRVEFSGPKVYWEETYATASRNDQSPNSMWSDRPRGQIDKCAEAAALRAAFPEEVGGDYIPEEVQHIKTHPQDNVIEATAGQSRSSELRGRLGVGDDNLEGESPPLQPYTEEGEESAETVESEPTTEPEREPGDDGEVLEPAVTEKPAAPASKPQDSVKTATAGELIHQAKNVVNKGQFGILKDKFARAKEAGGLTNQEADQVALAIQQASDRLKAAGAFDK